MKAAASASEWSGSRTLIAQAPELFSNAAADRTG